MTPRVSRIQFELVDGPIDDIHILALLGAGGSKSQANGANSRSLENVLASAERPDGASGNRTPYSLAPPAGFVPAPLIFSIRLS